MYRKQTYTGQLLNFNALRPDKWGKGLIIYLLNIAKHLCLSDTLFNNKVDELRKIFKPNSYPISHFNKIFDSFLNSSVTLNCDSYEEVDYVLIKIPFTRKQYYTLSKRLKKILT